jgi:preprotein translocase subunit SecD
MGQNYVDFAYVLGICTAVSYFVTYIISRALIKQVLRIGIKNAGLYLGIKGEHK